MIFFPFYAFSTLRSVDTPLTTESKNFEELLLERTKESKNFQELLLERTKALAAQTEALKSSNSDGKQLLLFRIFVFFPFINAHRHFVYLDLINVSDEKTQSLSQFIHIDIYRTLPTSIKCSVFNLSHDLSRTHIAV